MAKHPKLGILHPAWILAFLGLAGLWLVAWLAPEPEGVTFRIVARVSGYLGALAMLIPYLHIIRRSFRHRNWGFNVTWLRWHIGAAYLAFFFVLIHSRGRGASGLTLTLQILLWTVMLSGVVGYYGQKLLYYLLPRLIECELGRERLGPQREFMLNQAHVLSTQLQIKDWKSLVTRFQEKNSPLMTAFTEEEREEIQGKSRVVGRQTYKTFEEEISAKVIVAHAFERVLENASFTASPPTSPGPELEKLLIREANSLSIAEIRTRNHLLLESLFPNEILPVRPAAERFCSSAIQDVFQGPLRLIPIRKMGDAFSENRFLEVSAFVETEQRETLSKFWRLVKERWQVDLEYRLHQLGRLWLLVHGPAAWALLVLMIEHILMSIWYGGF